MIASAAFFGNDVHHLLNDGGGSCVITVGGFSVLEVGVAVLRSTLLNGMLGVERAGLEVRNVGGNAYFVADGAYFGVIIGFVPNVYFGNFVARSEAVEEVYKGNLRTERGEMSDESKVHNFLNGAVANHSKARLAASHNVRMVAENVKGVSSQSARRNMHNHGHKLAGYFVHIGNHQEQALRRGVRAGKRARAKRAVNCARSSAFGLHFRNPYFLSPHVGSACGRPFVRNFCHGRRRGDGINRRYFRKGVGDVTRGGVAVDCQFFHQETSDKYIILFKLIRARTHARLQYYNITCPECQYPRPTLSQKIHTNNPVFCCKGRISLL